MPEASKNCALFFQQKTIFKMFAKHVYFQEQIKTTFQSEVLAHEQVKSCCVCQCLFNSCSLRIRLQTDKLWNLGVGRVGFIDLDGQYCTHPGFGAEMNFLPLKPQCHLHLCCVQYLHHSHLQPINQPSVVNATIYITFLQACAYVPEAGN